MSDLRQAAQQALEALERADKDDFWREQRDAITALKAALEQQAEPVHGDIRALKYRIHELEGEVMGYKRMLDVAEAASQPQQQTEPVAWMDREGDLYKMPEITNWAPPHTMLYTASPQRQWVGLTDEDFLEACQIAERGNYLLAFQRIQIKLKEKNSD